MPSFASHHPLGSTYKVKVCGRAVAERPELSWRQVGA